MFGARREDWRLGGRTTRKAFRQMGRSGVGRYSCCGTGICSAVNAMVRVNGRIVKTF